MAEIPARSGPIAARSVAVKTPVWVVVNAPTWTDPAGLPVFRITCHDGKVIESTDPGRALITGRCADVGAIAAQQLRGLSARAPYFVNGSAKTLGDVIDYYDRRFTVGFSAAEKQDLIHFLSVL